MVIAKIILSQYQLVENLGVKVIEMSDEQGNIVFLAKDGDVICNKGTFNGIKVTGDSEFSGTMKGVSGSFKSLNCVDNSGKSWAILPLEAMGECGLMAICTARATTAKKAKQPILHK